MARHAGTNLSAILSVPGWGAAVGLAMWAKCTPQAVAKPDKGMIEPDNRLILDEWTSGDEVWLVDLIAPFANAENRHRELMIADLISKPLKGTKFHFHQIDPATGKRLVQTIGADAGDKLLDAIKGAAASADWS
ncbi:toxin-activating lysine-acyltransferase [Sphingopyxis sp. LARHCG72]